MSQSRASWMKEARWGAFVHFLANPPSSISKASLSAEEWNARVDAFDVEGLATQLAEAGAKYLYLTLGQCSGHFCSPNATYERLTGTGKCSRRDLVLDMHAALAKRGIRLLAYLPSHGPSQDPDAMRKLKFTPPWDFSAWSPPKGVFTAADFAGVDARVTEGQRNWEAIIREWSLRWGDKVEGWWFDGCYYADLMYRHPDAPNFQSFAAAARAGNPESSVAWNPGVLYPPVEMDDEEDYTAGEINDPWKLEHGGKWLGRETYQILTFLGHYWCRGPVRFSAAEAAAFVQETNDYGGAVTWDLPIQSNGLIQADSFEALRGLDGELKKLVAGVKRASVKLTVEKEAELAIGGARVDGIVAVTLSNPWDCPVSGETVLGGADLEFKPGPELKWSLAPGASETRTLEVRVAECHPFGQPLEIERQRGEGKPPTKTALPVRSVLNLAQRKPLKSYFNGKAYSEVSVGIEDGGILALDFKIKDAIVKRDPAPWNGSCVELFIATAPGAAVRQYFLMPDETSPEGGLVEKAGSGEAPPQGNGYKVSRTADGYNGSARLPLTWLLKLDKPPRSFVIAFSTTTGDEQGNFIQMRLFGAEGAHARTVGFAVVEI